MVSHRFCSFESVWDRFGLFFLTFVACACLGSLGVAWNLFKFFDIDWMVSHCVVCLGPFSMGFN